MKARSRGKAVAVLRRKLYDATVRFSHAAVSRDDKALSQAITDMRKFRSEIELADPASKDLSIEEQIHR